MYIYIMMTRTQIYLDPDLYTNLKIGASLNKVTVSGYIRSLLATTLVCETKHRKAPTLSTLARSARRLGKSNIAKDFDSYLPSDLQ